MYILRRGNPTHCKSARPASNISAVTGNLLQDLKPFPIKKTQTTNLKIVTLEATSVPKKPKSKYNFLSKLFGKKGEKSAKKTGKVSQKQDSILDRPDIKAAISKARKSGNPTTGNPSQKHTNILNRSHIIEAISKAKKRQSKTSTTDKSKFRVFKGK